MGVFSELDDGCLLHIMGMLNPSPDVFLLARVSLRLKRLAHDSRNWLVVAPASSGAHPTQHHVGLNAANVYRSLAGAVAASRPGDTILLLAGSHPCVGVVLDKCLNLVGHGGAEDCTLTCSSKAGAALDVRSTCKMSNLSIRSQCGPCVVHRAGQLQLDGCHLSCDAHGLEHLVTPLVTAAVAGGQPGAGGRLTVTECLLEGGSRAVACEGSGDLQSVRVIYRARKTVFYLDVDCRSPGLVRPGLRSGLAAITTTSTDPTAATDAMDAQAEEAVAAALQKRPLLLPVAQPVVPVGPAALLPGVAVLPPLGRQDVQVLRPLRPLAAPQQVMGLHQRRVRL